MKDNGNTRTQKAENEFLAGARRAFKRVARRYAPIPDPRQIVAVKDHRLIDERSLAFDRLIVAKLRTDPTLLEKARTNLSRWLQTSGNRSTPDFLEWQRLIEGSFTELLTILESTDEHATRLRQSSPFCGILTPAERLAIIREYHQREAVAA